MDPFHIIEPQGEKAPILLSVPHCGIDFPEDIINNYNQDLIKSPDDTDWYVQDLYNFASELGITIIHAKYSRWVIDLNRDPESAPLYNDGRIITGLTPTTNFFGDSIYVSEDVIPDKKEIDNRLNSYYWPYYRKIEQLINELKEQYNHVLLWDAHSIRQYVPTIRKENFPDMILGNNDEQSAHPDLIKVALSSLQEGKYQVNHNTPFKGGHITRYFGKPSSNVHGLQLEMVKKLYMNDDETNFNTERANEVRSVLKPTFTRLIETLKAL